MKDYISANKKAYNALAKQYADRISEYEKSDATLIAPFINYLKTNFTNVRVLELGPGSGLALRFFQSDGFTTTAIEVANEIIKVARQTSPSTKFINDDFLKHNFSNQKYEGVFAKAFIHLFPKVDAELVLDKIYDLLVPRGAFFLATTIHIKPSEGYEQKSDYAKSPPRFRKKWTEAELMEALGNKWGVINTSYNQERGKNWIALTLAKKI